MAVLRGAAGWIILQAAAIAGGGRWAALALVRGHRVRRSAAGAGAVRSGKAGRLWALCRWRRWRWCVVIWCGGLLLAWSSGAALAALILPGAGCGRCDLLRLRCAGVVIGTAAATLSARRAADPAGRAGGRRGRWAKRKRPGRRRVVRCCSGLLSALAVAICCAGCIPVHIVGGGGLLPVPVPGCWRWH